MVVRVLVVDDTIAVRAAMRAILEGADMEIAGEASTGVEAVARYKELRPDLVTMDLVMPLMNGTEAARAILEFDARARIVAVSGLTQPSVMAEAQDVGMRGFIAKPLDPDEVLSEIQTLLEEEVTE